jgi:hypothetical protein
VLRDDFSERINHVIRGFVVHNKNLVSQLTLNANGTNRGSGMLPSNFRLPFRKSVPEQTEPSYMQHCITQLKKFWTQILEDRQIFRIGVYRQAAA